MTDLLPEAEFLHAAEIRVALELVFHFSADGFEPVQGAIEVADDLELPVGGKVVCCPQDFALESPPGSRLCRVTSEEPAKPGEPH